MKHIPIIFSFARSGGTLVNQLLGVHPDCLVLSEVNPAASMVSVTRQALDWLGLIEATETDQFQELPYSQQIALLDERSRARRKTLIIRDWVTVNYLPGAGRNSIMPSLVLEQPVYLARAGYSLRPLVVTRKANSVYRSIRSNFIQMANLSAEAFATAYLMYAHAVSGFPKVALEMLQMMPRETLVQIMQELGLSADHVDHQLAAFSAFDKCTGNNTLAVPSETAHARHILPVGRDSEAERAFPEICAFSEADRLLGYRA